MYRNFRSQNFYTFGVIWTHVLLRIIMYCQRLFLLFTGKEHCLHKHFFRGTYIHAMNICLHSKFKVWWCYGFGSTALQQD